MRIKYKKKIKRKKKLRTRILGFFHIGTVLKHKNRWKSIVFELTESLNSGNLLENTDLLTKVYLGTEQCETKNKLNNVKNISAGTDLGLYEGPALRELWKACNETDEEFYVYYIHNKGVSYPPNTKSEPWRKNMANAILVNWGKCISILDKGEKTCGIMWRKSIKDPAHYSGNFWWARASHIRTLEKPKKKFGDRRYFEYWLSPTKKVVLKGYPLKPTGDGKGLK